MAEDGGYTLIILTHSNEDRPRIRGAAVRRASTGRHQAPRARVMDLSALYRAATSCPPIIGNVLVYREHSHLTASWTKAMTPYVLDAIDTALG
jgi:hypothetical protein